MTCLSMTEYCQTRQAIGAAIQKPRLNMLNLKLVPPVRLFTKRDYAESCSNYAIMHARKMALCTYARGAIKTCNHFLRRPKSISRPRLSSKPKVNDSSGMIGKLDSDAPVHTVHLSFTFVLSRNVAHQWQDSQSKNIEGCAWARSMHHVETSCF
jgi:hypothetical protein